MRSFDPNLITVRNNPFSNSRARAIEDGVFMKHTVNQDHPYIPITDQYVMIGIVNKLMEKVKNIEDGQSSQHILILGEYGQGKSLSLKVVQDSLFIEFNSAIISYSIGGNASSILENDEHFRERIMEDIEKLFQSLDENLYSTKQNVNQKYSLTKEPGKTFHQFLRAYDNGFADLQIQAYIFIDELDKIVLSTTDNHKISNFLESIKLIADVCDKSISLIVAGTPNCLVKMNHLSIDYAQRFDTIENNFLTLDNTILFINQKCKTKLSHVGYFPFTKSVIRKIHAITYGNIRKIETVCRELWLKCAREQKKIDNIRINDFLHEKLFETILRIFPSINNQTVKFITDCFINNGRMSKAALQNYPAPDQRDVLKFLQDAESFKIVKGTYVMDPNLTDQIADGLLN